MTNYLDNTGLHTEALADIVSGLKSDFQTIYGADINLEPNSPDAQMINIFAQAKIDMLDCITQIYNSFSPETAVGVALDQRCAMNGIIRQGATHTQLTANVITDRGVTLPGLDLYPNAPFTVSDASGNKAQLVTTTTFTTGTTNAAFQAAVAGAVTFGSLTHIVTVTLGVTGLSGTATVTAGQDEETDAQLRQRRILSVSTASVGGVQSVYAAIRAVPDVTDALVHENATGSTDSHGVPAHTLWCIVEGGTNADVAQAIYDKRSVGVGMTGAVSQSIGATGTLPITIKFSRPLTPPLYVDVTVAPRVPTHILDIEANYVAAILANVSYGINETADPSDITVFLKSLDPLLSVVACQISSTGNTGPWTTAPLPTPTIQGIWTLSTPNINVTVE
jgi:uncharacterized phage protein gp47/JayE